MLWRIKDVRGRTKALLGTILREVDTPVWPAQHRATPALAFSRALVLERMRPSSGALQEAEVSSFQGLAFPPHSSQKAWASSRAPVGAGSRQGVGTRLLSARPSSWSSSTSPEWELTWELTWELPSPRVLLDLRPRPTPNAWAPATELEEGPVSLLVDETHRSSSCLPLWTS